MIPCSSCRSTRQRLPRRSRCRGTTATSSRPWLRGHKAEVEPSGPLVIGFDPAWMGTDRASMAWRRGRRLIKVESRSKLNTMEAAGWAKQVIDKEKPDRLFVDVGGVGAGVSDRLIEMGYSNVVRPVNFGS